MGVLNNPQPKPIRNDRIPLWISVIKKYASLKKSYRGRTETILKMMEDRNEFGFNKYEMYLTSFNGRNPILDLLQEKLDSLVYAEQCIEEGLDKNGEIAYMQYNDFRAIEKLMETLEVEYPDTIK